MKYADEFRDPELAKSLVAEVTRCTAPRVSVVPSDTVRSMLGLGVTVTIMLILGWLPS
jgi:hypothetical protein